MGYNTKTSKKPMPVKAKGYSSGGIAQKKGAKTTKATPCKAGASYKG